MLRQPACELDVVGGSPNQVQDEEQHQHRQNQKVGSGAGTLAIHRDVVHQRVITKLLSGWSQTIHEIFAVEDQGQIKGIHASVAQQPEP